MKDIRIYVEVDGDKDSTVRKRAPHCERLFATLEEALAEGDG